MTGPMRLLTACHSHPAITKGGAEIAAWRLHEALAARDDVHAWFLGCAREPVEHAGAVITQPFGPRQFLYTSTEFDWFKFANRDRAFPRAFAALLHDVQPQLLHFHHYVNFGVEVFLHIRRVLPEARIVLTLHEFQAICNHYGQMVTRNGMALCPQATSRDCNRCFPEHSRADFFLRQRYIRQFLDYVDQFIAPSHFLAARYVAWGLPESRMTVIENVVSPAQNLVPSLTPRSLRILRVGFFGQISVLKGINVLLDAARLLENAGTSSVRFDIHGDYSGQPAEFQTDFLSRLEKAGSNIRYHGPYDNGRIDALLQEVEVVAVPSIWWENSPVVIQECLRNGKPVICSDIGGMAEKVRPGIDGFHIPVGGAAALAELLEVLAQEPGHLAALKPRPAERPSPVEQHFRLFRDLLVRPVQGAAA
jgi:glycosyltransferase involved in cell wall biosynthesis